MVAALEDDQSHPLLVKAIHKAVFLIDATGPASRKVKAERFRLAKAFKRIAERITQQPLPFLSTCQKACVVEECRQECKEEYKLDTWSHSSSACRQADTTAQGDNAASGCAVLP